VTRNKDKLVSKNSEATVGAENSKEGEEIPISKVKIRFKNNGDQGNSKDLPTKKAGNKIPLKRISGQNAS
jgi:hypothetical protein